MAHEDRAAPPVREKCSPTVDRLRLPADECVELFKPVQDFRQFVEIYIKENNCYGLNGYNDRVSFVPRPVLDRYWTLERIDHVLWSPSDRIKTTSSNIKQAYLLTFSILVFMARPEGITTFIGGECSDVALPLHTIPTWASESSEREVFEVFEKEQWRFCPLTLNMETDPKPLRRQLSPYHIIPILEKNDIDKSASGGDEANIYKVKLHHECSSQDDVIFKIYTNDGADAWRHYDNEVDMYSNLDPLGPIDNIMRYYGSYESAGLCTIILEYANGGTLESFFENYPPPNSQTGRELFWASLMNLLVGLEHIHNLTVRKYGSKGEVILKGTYQDIRPKNILVCKQPDKAMYDVTFKFVDMGTGHIRRTKHQGFERVAVDQLGNGMYSAPEAFRDNGDARGICAESDIWSLGGIASEALVWSVWGEHGRSKYQQERVAATRETHLKGGFHEGAFHDGDCLLDIVESWHKRTVDSANEARDWYSKLSRIIFDHMLVPEQKKRADASTLRQIWSQVLTCGPAQNSAVPDGISNRSTSMQFTEDVASLSEGTLAFHFRQDKQITDADHNKKLETALRTVDEEAAAESLKSSPVSHGQSPNLGLFPQNPKDRFELSGVKSYLDSPPNSLFAWRRRSSQAEPTGSRSDPWGLTDGGVKDSTAMERSVSDTGRIMLSLPAARGESDKVSVMSGATAVAEEGIRGIPPLDPHVIEAESIFPPGLQLFQQRQLESPYSMQFTQPYAFSRSHRASQVSPRSHHPPPNVLDYAYTQAKKLITMEMVWTTCLATKERRATSWFSRRTSSWSLFNAFPELKAPISRLKGNDGRDQIFLVDDSKSMIWHRPTVAKACRVLSYVLKLGRVDPDATFELYFTSSKKPESSTRSSDLQRAIETSVFSDDQCDMASSLDLLVSRVIKNPKPVSIYVLTNGHWNLDSNDRFCGVDRPIRRLVQYIAQRNMQRNWAGVQFVRFYDQQTPSQDDETGKKRLKALDDELKAIISDDIVDTVDFMDDVRKILIGAISPDIDNSP
nr:uncharacterized protein CTRU02_01111 [Colletotrichum truncatum]KAF6800706.1 hypothetical protein CTRU02_01111 [Colletotrichum truncatum]